MDNNYWYKEGKKDGAIATALSVAAVVIPLFLMAFFRRKKD